MTTLPISILNRLLAHPGLFAASRRTQTHTHTHTHTHTLWHLCATRTFTHLRRTLERLLLLLSHNHWFLSSRKRRGYRKTTKGYGFEGSGKQPSCFFHTPTEMCNGGEASVFFVFPFFFLEERVFKWLDSGIDLGGFSRGAEKWGLRIPNLILDMYAAWSGLLGAGYEGIVVRFAGFDDFGRMCFLGGCYGWFV